MKHSKFSCSIRADVSSQRVWPILKLKTVLKEKQNMLFWKKHQISAEKLAIIR